MQFCSCVFGAVGSTIGKPPNWYSGEIIAMVVMQDQGEKILSNLTTRLDVLIHKIKQETPSARFRLQPQLGDLISELEAEGARVKRCTKLLNEELLNEAIEAQFDNMPV